MQARFQTHGCPAVISNAIYRSDGVWLQRCKTVSHTFHLFTNVLRTARVCSAQHSKVRLEQCCQIRLSRSHSDKTLRRVNHARAQTAICGRRFRFPQRAGHKVVLKEEKQQSCKHCGKQSFNQTSWRWAAPDARVSADCLAADLNTIGGSTGGKHWL